MRPSAAEAVVRILKPWPVLAKPLLDRTRGSSGHQPYAPRQAGRAGRTQA